MAAQRRKECRGLERLVVANGGARGVEVGGVRSPVAGEANGLGGVGHHRLTAALGGEEANGRKRGRGNVAWEAEEKEEKERKKKIKENEREEKWREKK